MSWAEIKKAINSDLNKPLNVKIDELAEPGMFGMDIISGLRFLRGVYPYHNGAADITISVDTTWDDVLGYKRVGKLTVAAGVKLTIARFPFFILADEIEFGDTSSWICADGLSGFAGMGYSAYPDTYARGAILGSTARAAGGCGGGLLFILCNAISGANGKITADGGNGYYLPDSTSPITSRGGQGALSSQYIIAANAAGATTIEDWKTGLIPIFVQLGVGGGLTTYAGTGGGSGGQTTALGAGGSGIGGGGAAGNAANVTVGAAASTQITPSLLMLLAQFGCKGGGAGGAYGSDTVAGRTAGGGGGGGAVCVLYKTKTATPALQANGGTGSYQNASYPGSNGGAGLTFLLEVPA